MAVVVVRTMSRARFASRSSPAGMASRRVTTLGDLHLRDGGLAWSPAVPGALARRLPADARLALAHLIQGVETLR